MYKPESSVSFHSPLPFRRIAVLCCLTLALPVILGSAPAGAATYALLHSGNSITEGTPVPPGFRQELYNLLNAGGDTYNFTGSSGSAPIQGHYLGGAKVRDFYPVSFGGSGSFDVGPDMRAGGPGTSPDLAVVHLGTNDLNSLPGPYAPYSSNHGQTLQNTTSGDMGELSKYLAEWATGGESWDLQAIVLSLIVPIQGRTADVMAYNNALIDLSEDFAEGVPVGSPVRVTLADHYTRFMSNPNLFTGGAGDWMSTGDDLHPNADGYSQMADVYRDAIEQTLNDTTAPAAVSNLGAVANGDDRISITFSATGDDGSSGRAARYDLRFSTSSINAANFALATQASGEPLPGNPGTSESHEITGLLEGTTYYVAIKVVDDGGNRSAVSNVAIASTSGASGDLVDDFNRPGPGLGPTWNADPEYQIVSNELANTSIDGTRIDYVATFVGMSNALGVGFRWSPTSDAEGRNQAGFALRLDAASPDANGYLLFRDDPLNGHQNRWNLYAIEAGNASSLVQVAQPSNMPSAPAGNDSVRVLLSSDAGGHHFDVLVNGQFDTRISDTNKTFNSPIYYAGFMSRGNMNNNIDDFTLAINPGENTPPSPFDLLNPPDADTLASTEPIFIWDQSFDPDPGDAVTYSLFVSQNPSFPSQETTRIDDILTTYYNWSDFLARDTTYYWKVRAEDLAGETANSNQTFSFYVPNLLSVVDEFERAELGDDWAADPARWDIQSGEMANIDAGTGFSVATFGARVNPTAVAITMGAGADSTGFHAAAGLAIMLDAASTTPSGYMVYRNWDPWFNWQLARLEAGVPIPIGGATVDSDLPSPVSGDEIRVVLSSDGAGHHFDIFVRGEFDGRLTDPDKLNGNAPTLYAGYVAAGSKNNNIDDFTLTGIDFNTPPAPFDLVGPPDGTLVISLAPLLEWEEAIDPNPDDQVSYRVVYDTDPSFPSPDSLAATTELSTPFTGPLISGESYYWHVRAYDVAGALALSNQTWSFSMAETLAVRDDFNRPGPELGDQWAGDSSMQITDVGGNGELNNTASAGLGIAVFLAATNPDAVQFDWGQNATGTGIRRGGLALMLDAATSTPNGYFVGIDPASNQSKLETIRDGAPGITDLDSAPGQTGTPGAGSEFRTALSSDGSGHHFDVYVNGIFHSRLTDPDKREGNDEILWAGAALRGDVPNNVDNFVMSAFNFGPPPEAFALLAPEHDSVDVLLQPELQWSAAGTAGTIYVVYVGTDSTFAAGTLDSVNVQSDTTLVWATVLELDTTYTWRVRATDGQQSSFNTLGWHRFHTQVTPVELVRFEALGEIGRIALRWETGYEIDHLGFHIWRGEGEEPATGEYERLTDALIQPGDAREAIYEFVDTDVEVGNRYAYRIEAVDRSGQSEFFGPVRGTALARPFQFFLAQNLPNPFNPSTELRFELAAAGPVQLSVYDIEGRLVRRLVDGAREAGPHTVRWDGRDQAGREVASGVYFSRLAANERVQHRKMMLIR